MTFTSVAQAQAASTSDQILYLLQNRVFRAMLEARVDFEVQRGRCTRKEVFEALTSTDPERNRIAVLIFNSTLAIAKDLKNNRPEVWAQINQWGRGNFNA